MAGMWWWYMIALASCIAACSVYCKLSAGRCRCARTLSGHTALVTGGSSGIGYHTALDLARRGARTIIASSQPFKGKHARDQIIVATGNTDVHYLKLDLQSFASVRNVAQTILKTEQRLDILVNNAGIIGVAHMQTEDGLNPTMQINHFGPFLLTNLLLPLLKASAPSRIVTVSSMLYRFGHVDLEDLNMKKRRKSTMSIYASSKLCNVLMNVELARRLRGTGVTANCLHPGMVMTDIHPRARSVAAWKKRLVTLLLRIFLKTAEAGAQTSIHLAVSSGVEGVSGQYFTDCRLQPYAAVVNGDVATKLWDVSDTLVGIQ